MAWEPAPGVCKHSWLCWLTIWAQRLTLFSDASRVRRGQRGAQKIKRNSRVRVPLFLCAGAPPPWLKRYPLGLGEVSPLGPFPFHRSGGVFGFIHPWDYYDYGDRETLLFQELAS